MKNLSSYNQDLSIPRKKDLDALETKVDGKQDAITGGASTIITSNLTANRALISNGSGKVAVSDITSTELGYLSGLSSDIQTQLNNEYDRTAEKAYYFFTTGSLVDNDVQLSEEGFAFLLEMIEKWIPYEDSMQSGQSNYEIPYLVCADGIYDVTVCLRLTTYNIDTYEGTFSGYYIANGDEYLGVVHVTNIGIDYSAKIPVIKSVNNKTGIVELTASDVGAQPKITVNGIVQGDGAGNLSAVETINADLLDLNPAAVGLGNVDNVKQYSATNPPPYPVKSVNGLTGAVIVPVLPDVSADDNGKILTVVDGTWVLVDSLYQTSYVGTGAYGSANPNTLSFDFVPKLVMITILSGSNAQVPTFFTQGYAWAYFMNVSGTSAGSTTVTASAIVVTWSEDGKTLSWYGKGTTATGQLNADGYTYRVTAWR